MKKIMRATEVDRVLKTFRMLGFRPLKPAKPNANGPDLWVLKNEKAYSVEIKSTRLTKRGSLQVNPVEKNRRSDDFIAIKIGDYVLVEPMEHHLKNCTPAGHRTMTNMRIG